MHIEGKHRCFICKQEFTWGYIESEPMNKAGLFNVYTPKEASGEVAFISEDQVEIDAKCPYCKSINRFKQSVKK